MFKKLFALAFAGPALTLFVVPAFAAEPVHFTNDGNEFVATVSHEKGRDVIDGRNLTTRENFHLVVAHGRVTGHFGNSAVSFAGQLPVEAAAATPAQVATAAN